MNDLIERYEYKYLVPEHQLPWLRDMLQTVCRRDRFSGTDGRYRVRSLYLDTDQLDLYQANGREQRDRFKARIRCYPGIDGPVFLEIKRRVGDVILKSRAPVSPDAWLELVRGNPRALDALPANTRRNAEQFLLRVQQHHLRPSLLVEYEREAYASEFDAYARVTFDRNILAQPKERLELNADGTRWRSVDDAARTFAGQPVSLLELKFERRPPAWMVGMVQRLELVRRSFSKYAHGVRGALDSPQLRTATEEAGAPTSATLRGLSAAEKASTTRTE